MVNINQKTITENLFFVFLYQYLILIQYKKHLIIDYETLFILETYNQPLLCFTTLKFIQCGRNQRTTSTTYY